MRAGNPIPALTNVAKTLLELHKGGQMPSATICKNLINQTLTEVKKLFDKSNRYKN